MGAVRAFAAAAMLVLAAPAHAESVADWRPYILEAKARFGVPAAWIEAVMQAESGGRTRLNGRPIRSPAGAIGLLQLMPGTWAERPFRLGLGARPDAPPANNTPTPSHPRRVYTRLRYT